MTGSQVSFETYRYRRQSSPGRVAFVAGCLALSGLIAGPALSQDRGQGGNDAGDHQIELFTEPIGLSVDAEIERVGALRYVGGVVIVSDDRAFGGLSGLIVSDDGEELLAVSDRGRWLWTKMTVAGGDITLADAHMAPILDWKGEEMRPADQDAEALAHVDGNIVVAFEGFHRIWQYSVNADRGLLTAAFATARPVAGGRRLDDQPGNGGIEAMASLPDGRLLAISEEAKTDGGHNRAWLIDRDGGMAALGFTAKPGFSPTDLARMPGGDFLVLQRRYTPISGVAASIGRIDGGSVIPGAVLEAEEIALLTPPMTVDNMEGLAVRQTGEGQFRLYLVSDNNFSALQRTILLIFDLVDADTP